MKRFPFFSVTMKPDDEGAGGDNDGSLIDATRAMPDIEALERGEQSAEPEKATRARDDNGRFKAKEAAEPEQAADKVEPEKAEEAPEEDDEDYFELPGEKEGDAPVRLKASDVYAGYQRSKQLEAEIAEAKAKPSAQMSEDAVKATEDLIKSMAEYQKNNEIFAAMQQVREPSMELLNQASEHYNPELYAQLKQEAAHTARRAAAARAEIERVGKERGELEQRLETARFQREQAKLNEFWPELMADKAVQQQVMTDAEKAYGFKAEDFNGIVDHRHYKVLKDALAYRAAQEKTEAAVKIVRAKPKLVKGAARSSVNPKDAKRADAMDRLSKSGSIEDAADALDGFLH
jgi:hypothetical protein